MTSRRLLLSLSTLAAGAVLLGGCAGLNQFSADVASYGPWPPGRAAGSYAFERLPSQQTHAADQQRLEDSARPALERAGFSAAAAGTEPEFLVQVGARVTRADRSPWNDPLWWHGGFGTWRHAPWRGPYWGAAIYPPSPTFDREVALLIRERSSGKPLFEAHASSEGLQDSVERVLVPLFDAALFDFPATGVNPRRVTVPLAH